MTAGTPEFDAAERAAIVAEWKRLAIEPPPTNPRPYGCATFLFSGILLLVLPKLLDAIGMPAFVGSIVLGLLVVALAGGFFVGLVFGNGVYGRALVRARTALDWLAANPESPDADERRRNAVALIFYTVVWDGPTVSTTLNPAQSREKLGAGLPYVLAVERVLVEDFKVQPVLGTDHEAQRSS